MRIWLRKCIPAAVVLCGRVVLAAADTNTDPWAPGASREPWPLLTMLQSGSALGADERAWEVALGHRDPLVRAAAAWAVGRTKPSEASRLVAPLITDPDIRVRDAALWAALMLDDERSLGLVARALSVRRRIGVSGRLFTRRGIPAEVAGHGAGFRREWLAAVDVPQLRPGRGLDVMIGIESGTWSAERSEWDADERVPIRATLNSTGGINPLPFALRSTLVPLDEPPGVPYELRRRIPVAVRRVDGGPRDELRLAPCTAYQLDLMLSLHDIPPGAYRLEGPTEPPAGEVSSLPPLLLRIRRSPRLETEVRQAAQAADTAEEIEAAGRHRVAAAAPRLRERLRAEIAGPRGPEVWPLLSALARMEDRESAGLMIEALRDRRSLYRPGRSYATNPDLMAFGPALLPHFERLARAWPEAVRRIGRDDTVVTVMGAVHLVTPELDAARLEAVRALAPLATPSDPGRVVIGSREANQRDIFMAALAAIAPRHPEDVGRALAVVSDRPALLAQALWAVNPPDFSAGPYTSDVDSIEVMLTTAWGALDARTPADSRAAIAAEAERLGIPLPGRSDALPESAAEAAREMGRTRDAPRAARQELLRRILASGLQKRDAGVARSAAELALALHLYREARPLADRAVELAPSGAERGAALLVRSGVHAALGDRDAQVADLEAAAPLVKEPDRLVEPPLKALERLRNDVVPKRLRVRVRDGRSFWNAFTVHDGALIVAAEDLCIERRDVVRGGGSTVIAFAPWPVRGLAAVDGRSVVAVAGDGSLALLRQGNRRPVWEARVDGFMSLPGRGRREWGALTADAHTVLVRDLESDVHAFDAATGRKLWTRPAAESVPLVIDGSDPVVIVTPPPPPPKEGVGGIWSHGGIGKEVPVPREVVGVDPRSGRPVWSAALATAASSWSVAAHRVAWLDAMGGVRVLDVRNGRELMRAELAPPGQGSPGGSIALSPDGSRVYASLADALFAVGPRGVIWSYTPDPTPSGGQRPTISGLVAGADAVWGRVFVPLGGAIAVWSPQGEWIADRRWPASFWDGPRLVDDRVVEVQGGAELVDLVRRPSP